MKILLATGVYPPEVGGPATYTKLLEHELPKRGDFHVRVLPFREVRHLPKVFRHAAYFLKCYFAAHQVDVVYAQDTVSVGFPASVAAWVAGKTFLIRVPGDYAWEQARQRFGVEDELDAFQNKQYGWRVELFRALQRYAVGSAKRVVVPSNYMRSIVLGWGANSEVETIYSSIHLPVAYEMPNDRPQGFLVVSAARRVPWKGIEALERVVAREKEWHFFLADSLPHKEAMGWIKVADVFVLNSTYEGLSHVLIEAMALGTPVVATNVGGNPELVANGSEGMIIEPKNDEDLYRVLKDIEAHPEEAHARAVRAQERAQEFSIDKTISKLVDLLHAL